MEVILNNNQISGKFNPGHFYEQLEKKEPVKKEPVMEIQSKIEKAALEESRKAMMDLEDVQKFLYMLIGSEIKVESDSSHVGLSVNTTA